MDRKDEAIFQKLSPYIGWKNPKLEYYQQLARNQSFHYLTARFSDRLLQNCETREVKKILRKALRGTPIFDLGCGAVGYSPVDSLAYDLKAKAYIGVDIDRRENWMDTEKIDRFLIKEDMLVFAAQIWPQSANFSFNGIDFLSGKYLVALVEEVERATKPGGVVFGVGSEPIDYELVANKKFVRVPLQDPEYSGDFFLYIKKK